MTHFISLGIHCTVASGIKNAGKRCKSYPFDWTWCPVKTTFHILELLINKSPNDACLYMTTGYKYYTYSTKEYFTLSDSPTINQINPDTGLGIVHDIINDEYKIKLTRRLERLLNIIKSNEKIVFLYSDAQSKYHNYVIDEITFGLDATKYLLKIYDLIKPYNQNIDIIYFAWKERMKECTKIKYIEHENVEDNNYYVIHQITSYILAL
jgi:hypothetical protein